MQKLIMAFATILFCFSLSAQPAAEQKAKAILKAATDKTKAYKTIKAEFVFTLENTKAKVKESKNGTILIKGDKYNLMMNGQHMISDGKTTWFHMIEAEEVQINSVTNDKDGLNPSKLLTTYDEKHKPKLIKEEMYEGKTVYVIDLVPTDAKNYFKVRVKIDKATNQIVHSAIYNKDNNVFSYAIKTLKPNVDIPDSKFIFKASDFPGIEVIDLR